MASLSPQERFAGQLAAAGITPEKPLHAVLWSQFEASQAAREAALAAQRAAETVVEPRQIVDEVGRAVRSTLHTMRPDLETRWRWRRWAELIAACAGAGMAAVVCISVGWWLGGAGHTILGEQQCSTQTNGDRFCWVPIVHLK